MNGGLIPVCLTAFQVKNIKILIPVDTQVYLLKNIIEKEIQSHVSTRDLHIDYVHEQAKPIIKKFYLPKNTYIYNSPTNNLIIKFPFKCRDNVIGLDLYTRLIKTRIYSPTQIDNLNSNVHLTQINIQDLPNWWNHPSQIK